MKKRKARATTRRGLGKARRQTHGNSGRERLAGPAFHKGRGLLGVITHPPAKFQKLQKKLGKRLRTLRTQQGLTPVQLGKDCGISTGKIEQIERGEVNVTLFIMIRLAHRLGLTVAQFLKGVG